MSKLVDIIFIQERDNADIIAETFQNRGFGVCVSNTEIDSSTHGKQQVWRLDILERSEIKNCSRCLNEVKIFEGDLCIQCFTDVVILKEEE